VFALVRHLAAVVVIALGCPVALFAGVRVTCAQSGMSPECAQTGLLVSPIILALTGVACAFLVRGLLGFLLGAVGILLGMTILWIVLALTGDPVPLDIAQGAVATIWFGLPSVIGYSLTRVAIWMVRRVVPA
jgi:hypothetical protein